MNIKNTTWIQGVRGLLQSAAPSKEMAELNERALRVPTARLCVVFFCINALCVHQRRAAAPPPLPLPPRLSGDIKAITLSRVQLFSVMEGWEWKRLLFFLSATPHPTRSLHGWASVVFKNGHGVPAAVIHELRKQKVARRLGIRKKSRLFNNQRICGWDHY